MSNANYYSPEELIRARQYGDCIVTDTTTVAYQEWLSSPEGMSFILLREPHHTDDDIAYAKSFLRDNRDVLTIYVIGPRK